MAQMTMDLSKLVNLICLLLTIAFHISRGQSLEWQQKVQTGLLDALARDGRATFIVCLSQKADLSSAYAIQDWEQRGQYVYEKLTTTARESQKHVLSQLDAFKQSGELTEFNSFWIKNAIGVTSGTESVVASLAVRSDIHYIRLPVDMEIFKTSSLPTYASTATIEWNISLIEATLAWSNLGKRGEGSIVGLIDTGVDFDHPALVNQYRGNLGNGNFDHNYNWYDPSGTYVSPADPNGHGTHVIGIAVGDDGQGNQIGVAPLAKWIAARTTFSEQNLTQCLQFMVAPTDINGNNPDPAKRPHVLNNSWGSCTFSDVLRDEVSALRAAGIVPIFAAGNTTNCGYLSAFCGSIATPATYKESFAVGATTSTGAIANFSLWGPSVDPTDQNAIKPDLSAPGENIRSSVPGVGYQLMSGTSMAAPHVAGTVAILLSAQPSLVGQVDKIQSQLLMTPNSTAHATNCGNEGPGNIPNNAHGEGRVNAYSAARFLYVPQVYSTIASAVNVATSGQTVIVAAGSYTTSSNLTVASGVTMTVSSGTTISFAAGTGLTVNGKLTANGTSTQPIVFTKSGTNNWQGITLNSASGSSLQYCDINYANAPLTANSTSSLTISNCKVQFSNFSGTDAAVRFSGSSPTVTSLTVSGQPGSTNGIRFTSSSGGSISSSVIENLGVGNGIVVQGGSSPTILSNTIRNNRYHGIAVDGNGTGSPLIALNMILNNGLEGGVKTYTGMNIKQTSTARIGSNTVQGSNYGIYWENNSTSYTNWTGSYSNLTGKNTISLNNSGLVATGGAQGGSFATFGDYDLGNYYGACNQILDNTDRNALATNSSAILAEGNWWGAYPPDPAKIFADGSSNVWYDHALTSSSCPGGAGPAASLVFVPSGTSQNQAAMEGATSFTDAVTAFIKGMFSTARDGYGNVLKTHSDDGIRAKALLGLLDVFRETKDESVIQEIASYASLEGEVGLTATKALIAIYASSGRFHEAKNLALGLYRQYPETELEKAALLYLVSLKWFDASQQETSDRYLAELMSKYGSAIDGATRALLGLSGSGSGVNAKNMNKSSQENQLSFDAYPNPFNPSTNFEFRIAQTGFVSLKIYDLLGREVAVLVNEEKQPGPYSVTWNADAMPSGVYFSRLESNGKSVIKQLLLVR